MALVAVRGAALLADWTSTPYVGWRIAAPPRWGRALAIVGRHAPTPYAGWRITAPRRGAALALEGSSFVTLAARELRMMG